MNTFEPLNPNYQEHVRLGFAQQRVMETIGARLVRIEPGQVQIELGYREDLTQQHGYLHVIKPGRTLTVCVGEALATDGAEQRVVAVIQTTMMRLSESIHHS